MIMCIASVRARARGFHCARIKIMRRFRATEMKTSNDFLSLFSFDSQVPRPKINAEHEHEQNAIRQSPDAWRIFRKINIRFLTDAIDFIERFTSIQKNSKVKSKSELHLKMNCNYLSVDLTIEADNDEIHIEININDRSLHIQYSVGDKIGIHISIRRLPLINCAYSSCHDHRWLGNAWQKSNNKSK